MANYLTLVATTLVLWRFYPGAALIAFLCLSLIHFGDQDAVKDAPVRVVRVAAHGGAVIIVPAVFHPATVERLFALLAPAHAHELAAFLGGPVAISWVAAATATIAIHALSRRTQDWKAVGDLLLVILLFSAATPLIAFSAYFAAIHTPRALSTSCLTDRRITATVAIPAILTILAFALGFTIYLAGEGMSISSNLVRTAFLLLSALTVPHIWLRWRADQYDPSKA